MKTIIWDHNIGTSDNSAMDLAENLLVIDQIVTGNQLVIDCARRLRVQGKIDDLQVVWDGKVYPVNEYGALPTSYDVPNLVLDVSEGILRLAMAKRRVKK